MRVFVAIDLPESVRAALARAQARLRAACARNPGIRWTRPEGLHITLKFLGEISADHVPALAAALQGVGPFEKFSVEVKGFGFFPDARHPRVLWAGIDAPPALRSLAERVDAALSKLDFPPEDRPFRPHLTLARFRAQRPEPALEAALEELSSTSLGCFDAAEYFLFESRLRPGGAEYNKLTGFRASADDSARHSAS
jgi:RNA 2',3'-cyclic 3'-phosphodiesterase